MFPPDQYALLDFGRGRKLERFGPYILDRTSPPADGTSPAQPALWSQAAAIFERLQRDSGEWEVPGDVPKSWQIRHHDLVFELQRTSFGHLGIFPEQAENWDWIAAQVRAAGRPLKVLNLFAYTGGSTLAAASAGAEVVHIDAAKNVVAWARRNAEHSGLAERTIRWIAEDASRFVQRELRRGNQYDAVILDPPSYGHGPAGEVWKLNEQLPQLLADCAQLTAGRLAFLLLTCHTPGFGSGELRHLLSTTFDVDEVETKPLALATAAGR
ncbi:MAG TPA: class I SAM-dependent methyltransferase, partial [Pirellulaceae bacterium]|nr:class I SAM-dependent methyltransferase [Pirellulaceae bacterium]